MSNKRTYIFGAVISAVLFAGCSNKEVTYAPYPTNSELYRQVIDKNRLEWKNNLMPEMTEYKDELENIFMSIDNYSTYLSTVNNKKVIVIKEAPKTPSTTLHYEDVIFKNEYGF